METKAPRSLAVIGIAVVAAAFALGYYLALPASLGPSASGDQVAAAVQAALLEPNQLERAAKLGPILASLDAQNLDTVVGVYEATFTGLGPGSVALEMLTEAWSKTDPAGAFERINGWNPYYRNMALPLLMRSWARRDRASARAATETLKQVEQASYSEAVILGWADSGDPGIWDAYVAEQPFGSKAAYPLMQRIAASEGIDALLRRAESVPENAADGFRPVALRNATDIAAQSNPESAAAFAERNRGMMEGGLQWIVAARWAAIDAPRATEWALTQPAGATREGALRAAFLKWVDSDEKAAVDWARAQSDEVLTPILGIYARSLGKSDPKQALEISKRLSDPEDRYRTQMVVSQGWLMREPEPATDWLKQNGFADLIPKRRAATHTPTGRPAAQPQEAKGDR